VGASKDEVLTASAQASCATICRVRISLQLRGALADSRNAVLVRRKQQENSLRRGKILPGKTDFL